MKIAFALFGVYVWSEDEYISASVALTLHRSTMNDKRASALYTYIDSCVYSIFSIFLLMETPMTARSLILLHLYRTFGGPQLMTNAYASRFGLAESLWTYILARNMFFVSFLFCPNGDEDGSAANELYLRALLSSRFHLEMFARKIISNLIEVNRCSWWGDFGEERRFDHRTVEWVSVCECENALRNCPNTFVWFGECHLIIDYVGRAHSAHRQISRLWHTRPDER